MKQGILFVAPVAVFLQLFYSSAYAASGSISINSGAGVTNSQTVTLGLYACGGEVCIALAGYIGASEMKFSNDGYIWSTSEPASISKTWTLTPGYGPKTVYVMFMSDPGVWFGPYSDTIIYADAPDPFSFTGQYPVSLNTLIYSNTVTITGMQNPQSVSITGGEYSINGGPFTAASGTINNGSTVQVRQTSSPSYHTRTDTTLDIAGVSSTFSVTTPYPDTTPDPFTFIPQYNVPLNTVATSSAITVSGIEAPSSIRVSGGEYSVNNGAFTLMAGTVLNGDTVAVRQTSSSSYSISTDAILTIGGVNSTFRVSTISGSSVTSVGYSSQWLIITLFSLMLAGGYLAYRRTVTNQ